jgi:thiamine thiazole synthase
VNIDDIAVSEAIIRRFSEKLLDSLESDTIIVGGGPAGLTAGYYLAKSGVKTLLLERKLSVGGGMWGGGIMFNEIVVQREARDILEEFGIPTTEFRDGYFTADSVRAVSTITSQATAKGLRVFNLLSAEDVMIRDGRVTGLVVNWTSVEMAGLHVDPISFRSRFVIDATGHATEIGRMLQDKLGEELMTPTGKLMGEKWMHAQEGERTIVENTKEFFPGVYVAGMACNAVFGGPRMGPIFGGMLLSGKKVAGIIADQL